MRLSIARARHATRCFTCHPARRGGCRRARSFSLKIDRAWTIDCVDRALQRAEAKAPADMKAVLTALGAETPRLIDVINGAGPATPAGAALAAPRDPASPAHSKAVRPVGKD
jgi:hypothetical protein